MWLCDSASLCDYADSYIIVQEKITVTGAGDDAAARRADERNIGAIFENCAPFIKCINKINDTEIDNTQDIDVVMPMHNLIEYSNNYWETSGSLCEYYKDSQMITADSKSFKYNVKETGRTPAGGNTRDLRIIVPLKFHILIIIFQK